MYKQQVNEFRVDIEDCQNRLNGLRMGWLRKKREERAEQAAVVHGAVCCCSEPFERDGVAYVAWSPSCQIHTRDLHQEKG